MKSEVSIRVAAAFVLLSLSSSVVAESHPEDFARKFTVSVGDGFEGAGADNVPVLLRLSEDSPTGFVYADLKNGGKDMMIVDAEGNPIPFEIDTWDPAGESCVWVRMPRFEKDKSFTVYYGKEEEDGQSATSVWSDYLGVWHMGEDAGLAVDATGNGLDGVPTANSGYRGTPVADVMVGDTGVIGKARINATATAQKSTYLSIPSYQLTTSGNFTVSGWFKMSAIDNTSAAPRLFSSKLKYSDANGFEVELGKNTKVSQTVRGASNASGMSFSVSHPDVVENWVHFAYVYEGGTVSAYVNGTLAKTGSVTPSNEKTTLSIGSNSDGSEWSFNGKYDEVRLVDGCRSASAVAAEYAAMTGGSLVLGEVSAVDETAPVMGDVSLSVDASGKVTVGLGFDKNFPASESVSVEVADVRYPMSTTDTALPATYSVSLENLPGGKTYLPVIHYASTAGTVFERTARAPFYQGILSVAKSSDADEATSQPGAFVISRADAGAALPVRYTVSGTALPDATYEALSGATVIPAGARSVMIPVVPIPNSDVSVDGTVTIRLEPLTYATTSASHATLSVLNASVVSLASAEQFVSCLQRGPNGAYELADDLDLAGAGYTAIPCFAGTLDGKGHVITGLGGTSLCLTNRGEIANLTIDGAVNGANTVRTENNIGIFACQSVGGTFTDCCVKGYTLKHPSTNGKPIGGICGTAYDGSTFIRCVAASDCSFEQNGKANNHIGGLVGLVDGKIGAALTASFVACTNCATIKATGDYAGNFGIGGLVGTIQGSSAAIPEVRLLDSVNEGPIVVSGGSHIIGGLVGKVMGAQAKDRTIRLLVDRCVNTASFDVTQSGDALGGLVGRFSHAAIGTIRNSRNTGDIQAPNYTYVGGLVGYIGPYMPSIGGGVQIENSANYGSVSGKDAGGLVGEFNTNTGWASGQMVVNNSASYGTVTGTDAAGGVVSKVVCAGKGPVAFDNCLTAGISYQTATSLEPTPSNMLDLASESYDAQAALAALNGVAVENPAYVPWVMGTDHPELALFASAADPVVLYCDWDGSLLAKGEEPETPQRTGFVFAGWREITDADAGCSMWVAEYEPVSCRVSFDFENGQPVLVKSFDYEAVVKFPSDPTRDGYTFCGWARRMAVEDARLVTGDIDYTAIWKKVKQPTLAKLRVLQWTLYSGDTRHRAAIAAELKAQFDAENPDVFISCGSEQSQAFVDVLAAAIPDYTFVYLTGNGSADCGARLFAWKTARFEAADVVKEMFISNATTGWIPLREKGTENYYVLMSAFSGTTKNMTEYFNALPAFYTKIRAKHPTATFILGANYEKFKDAPSATIFESTYESDPAKVMSDLEERTDFTHVQAGDDFQWLLYQSAYDPIDVEVGAVKRFNGEQNSRFGNVVSFKFGRAPGFIVSIR